MKKLERNHIYAIHFPRKGKRKPDVKVGMLEEVGNTDYYFTAEEGGTFRISKDMMNRAVQIKDLGLDWDEAFRNSLPEPDEPKVGKPSYDKARTDTKITTSDGKMHVPAAWFGEVDQILHKMRRDQNALTARVEKIEDRLDAKPKRPWTAGKVKVGQSFTVPDWEDVEAQPFTRIDEGSHVGEASDEENEVIWVVDNRYVVRSVESDTVVELVDVDNTGL